jgi:hypothetical protein
MAPDATRNQSKRQGAPAGGSPLSPVASPSARGETFAVVRAAVVIGALTLVWISRGPRGDDDGDDPGFAPWQRAFSTLDPDLQRDLRELHEAGEEAVRWRGDRGAWPAPADLAAESIAPFRPRPGAPERTFRRSDLPYLVQYLGHLDGRRSLLLQVMEPRPGENEGRDGASLPPDEQHRTLPDGSVLHLSFWVGPEPVADRTPHGEFLADPARHGFEQVLFGRPGTAGERPRRGSGNSGDGAE